jgi:hypothetical protein
MLSGAIAGKRKTPRRVLAYGTHGIGKSTWAAAAPSPFFIATEDGLDNIGCDRTPWIRDLGGLNGWLSRVSQEPHDHRTIVVDSLDWMERLIHDQVAIDAKVKSIDDISYFRGYTMALKYWDSFLREMEHIRSTRNMAIILLAHARSMKHEPPDGEAYTRYEPDLDKRASPMLQEWADEVLFFHYEVKTVRRGQGFDERSVAIGDGKRTVFTCETPTHLAKRRAILPDRLPMDFKAYATELAKNYKTDNGNIAHTVMGGHHQPTATETETTSNG